ncbi:MAG: DUF3120 domain-containing protein [Microcystis wesenbergii Mw_QC_S_20081001_S30D]|uniref:DUF3120 domain-containing protein n=1 Tax=Microcystis wesenbergii Mw_QC_S_20081001_S30D TaxID=2486245 RepID=A0A552JZT1_9CHRO|nr:DUF3120 domain-containing protein [Microcystis aeruginosa W11-03]NCR92820.1 DUF3120 domain-containing protein [Microcystis aeruginosa W11-06]TRU96570.1 MAG: DUF3120 domain-containing protein [Microcystis wesenbergii Mw_QC_B_20070930_S4D]TRV01230.1 MAG: DUF3120 domain-containing protein [Microcystis wesenbergii Mw_QC_S_20081001_S30D]TRV05358.1 MAG: DUF3120 domain-containing protein [Microcystis wesenbergii Mw_QC_S_20081001_S30]TRV10262.1 MAG: DUF3120 domain-containing protein [Microcystis we
MLNSTLVPSNPDRLKPLVPNWEKSQSVFWTAAFLVSVPVFMQAPLVRYYPEISLGLTVFWVGLGIWLLKQAKISLWGDLLLGFSWSWLAGSLYWGWWRWEPLIHIPMEAIGLPFVLWGLYKGRGKVGNLFYLGSLLGTAITDLYFYLTGLIPYWRQLMTVELDPNLVSPIFHNALAQIQTPWGVSWAIVLLNLLLAIGIYPLQKRVCHWWAFSGAVLSTILVDGLFWITASLA